MAETSENPFRGASSSPSAVNRLGQYVTRFTRMSYLERGTVIGAIVLVITGLAWSFHTNDPQYASLLRNTELADAAEMTKILKEQKIPYKLEDDGGTVLVPRESLSEARILVAAKGLPHGGTTGFELFDRSNLNVSESGERVTWLRALQGELARTIQEIDGVERARVHLSLPEEGVFAEARKQTGASVTLRLKRGVELSRENVAAVVALVSRSVPGLDADHVSVVTHQGRVLWDKSTEPKKSSRDDDATARFERTIQDRVTSMLTPVVGEGRCVVRVSAELDFTERDVQTNRILHDDTQPRSRQTAEENYKASPAPSGSPQSDYGRRSETVQYEMGTEASHQIIPGGRIKSIRLAVLIDETAARTISIVRVESLVGDAAGLDRARGDRLTVQTLPFRPVSVTDDAEPPAAASPKARSSVPLFVIGTVIIALTMLTTGMTLRRRPRPVPSRPRSVDSARTATLLKTWMAKEDQTHG